MRRLSSRFVLFSVAGIVAMVAAKFVFALPSGFTGRTLLTSSSGCGGCHGGSPNTGVQASIVGPTTLAPNQTALYTITVSVGTSTSTKAGVDIAASTGTLSPVSSRLSLVGGEITHNTSLTRGTAYSFNYTAPLSGGSVTLYATVAGDANTWNWASNVVITLPVQLASFVAQRIPSGGVRLDWRTVSEANNYGFFIQRKRIGSLDWLELPGSFVAGHGTTNVPQSYSFIDVASLSEPSQYRLKQVDLDGMEHFSEPVFVSSPTLASSDSPTRYDFTLQQNYPNPFNPTTTIRFTLAENALTALRVFDLNGREVATLLNKEMRAGKHEVSFEARNLASGVYVYTLFSGSFIVSKKLSLVK